MTRARGGSMQESRSMPGGMKPAGPLPAADRPSHRVTISAEVGSLGGRPASAEVARARFKRNNTISSGVSSASGRMLYGSPSSSSSMAGVVVPGRKTMRAAENEEPKGRPSWAPGFLWRVWDDFNLNFSDPELEEKYREWRSAAQWKRVPRAVVVGSIFAPITLWPNISRLYYESTYGSNPDIRHATIAALCVKSLSSVVLWIFFFMIKFRKHLVDIDTHSAIATNMFFIFSSISNSIWVLSDVALWHFCYEWLEADLEDMAAISLTFCGNFGISQLQGLNTTGITAFALDSVDSGLEREVALQLALIDMLWVVLDLTLFTVIVPWFCLCGYKKTVSLSLFSLLVCIALLVIISSWRYNSFTHNLSAVLYRIFFAVFIVGFAAVAQRKMERDARTLFMLQKKAHEEMEVQKKDLTVKIGEERRKAHKVEKYVRNFLKDIDSKSDGEVEQALRAMLDMLDDHDRTEAMSKTDRLEKMFAEKPWLDDNQRQHLEMLLNPQWKPTTSARKVRRNGDNANLSGSRERSDSSFDDAKPRATLSASVTSVDESARTASRWPIEENMTDRSGLRTEEGTIGTAGADSTREKLTTDEQSGRSSHKLLRSQTAPLSRQLGNESDRVSAEAKRSDKGSAKLFSSPSFKDQRAGMRRDGLNQLTSSTSFPDSSVSSLSRDAAEGICGSVRSVKTVLSGKSQGHGVLNAGDSDGVHEKGGSQHAVDSPGLQAGDERLPSMTLPGDTGDALGERAQNSYDAFRPREDETLVLPLKAVRPVVTQEAVVTAPGGVGDETVRSLPQGVRELFTFRFDYSEIGSESMSLELNHAASWVGSWDLDVFELGKITGERPLHWIMRAAASALCGQDPLVSDAMFAMATAPSGPGAAPAVAKSEAALVMALSSTSSDTSVHSSVQPRSKKTSSGGTSASYGATPGLKSVLSSKRLASRLKKHISNKAGKASADNTRSYILPRKRGNAKFESNKSSDASNTSRNSSRGSSAKSSAPTEGTVNFEGASSHMVVDIEVDVGKVSVELVESSKEGQGIAVGKDAPSDLDLSVPSSDGLGGANSTESTSSLRTSNHAQWAARFPALDLALLGVSSSTLVKYVSKVEEGYVATNAYHNAYHAADVLQASFHFILLSDLCSLDPELDKKARAAMHATEGLLRDGDARHDAPSALIASGSSRGNNCAATDELMAAAAVEGRASSAESVKFEETIEAFHQARAQLSLELLSLLVGAAIHDLGHPGINNSYLIQNQDVLAITYNDKSVLENFHVAEGFRVMLSSPEVNVMASIKDDRHKTVFRRSLIDLVIATDLGNHLETVNHYTQRIDGHRRYNRHAQNDRKELFEMVLKMADISHPARPFKMHNGKCANHAVNFLEFDALQGDLERENGQAVNPMFDRQVAEDPSALPKSQTGFIDFLVRPLLRCFVAVSGENSRHVQKHLDENYNEWRKQIME